MPFYDDYPEHEKLSNLAPMVSTLGRFLTHLEASGIVHVRASDGSRDLLIAQFLGVDTTKIRAEQDLMQRRAHERITPTKETPREHPNP